MCTRCEYELYLHSFDHFCDPATTFGVLSEQDVAAQVRSPHVIDAHRGVEAVQQLVEYVLVGCAGVLRVDGRGHGLQHAEEYLLSGTRELQRAFVRDYFCV